MGSGTTRQRRHFNCTLEKTLMAGKRMDTNLYIVKLTVHKVHNEPQLIATVLTSSILRIQFRIFSNDFSLVMSYTSIMPYIHTTFVYTRDVVHKHNALHTHDICLYLTNQVGNSLVISTRMCTFLDICPSQIHSQM